MANTNPAFNFQTEKSINIMGISQAIKLYLGYCHNSTQTTVTNKSNLLVFQNLCSHITLTHFLLIQHELPAVKSCFVMHQVVQTKFCLDNTTVIDIHYMHL